MKTLADKLDTVNTDQYTKARKLVDNRNIWIHRAYSDRVIFKIQGNNDQYELGFDPESKERMCGCPAETYNDGDCYHKIAAQIFLSQKTKVAQTVQKEIKFTEEHIQKIKDGEKETTLRTVKKDHLWPVGEVVQAKNGSSEVPIEILGRRIIIVTEDGVENYDFGECCGEVPYTSEQLADLEGFSSYDDLINWFKSRRYNIPQPMFLYNYQVVEEKQ